MYDAVSYDSNQAMKFNLTKKKKKNMIITML